MLYVLTTGWQWFAGALAIGLIVGFFATSRARAAEESGRWAPGAALLLLAALGAASYFHVAAGREGLAVDVAFLAGLAYFVGMPIGGSAKALVPAPAPEPKRPPIVVVRGRPPLEPLARGRRDEEPLDDEPLDEEPLAEEPLTEERLAAPESVTFEAGPAIAEIESVAPAPVVAVSLDVGAPAGESDGAPVAAEAVQPAPPVLTEPTTPAAPENAPAPAAAKSKKAHPGARPQSLDAPRGGKPDDLSKIKGVGPKSVEKLYALGVFHYDQVASWTLDNAKWIGAAIGQPGRVERGKWIQQAREIVAAGKGGG